MADFTICAILKNEAHYLYEWLSFHYYIGARRFVLYNNGSTDKSAEVIKKWPHSEMVELIDWPHVGGQLSAYRDMIERGKKSDEWCAFIDCDEFLVPQSHLSVSKVLDSIPESAAGVYIFWYMFGSSGYIARPKGLVTETYLRRAPDDFGSHHFGKSIVRLFRVQQPGVHVFKCEGPMVNDLGQQINTNSDGFQENASHHLLAINHYFTKSLQEWRERRALGKADKRRDDKNGMRSESEFRVHDINAILDTRAREITQGVRKVFYTDAGHSDANDSSRSDCGKAPQFDRQGDAFATGEEMMEKTMYVLTAHNTLVAYDQKRGGLTQVRSLTADGEKQLIAVEESHIATLERGMPESASEGTPISSGPLAGYVYVRSKTPSAFCLFMGGYACAAPNKDEITCDRQVANEWETFRFISPEDSAVILTPMRENDFQEKVSLMQQAGEPVLLHFGCGPVLLDGFLNIDKHAHFGRMKNYYIFDFAERSWPIPTASVDYIYSEDFVEHISQKEQIAFLAESFRVLKKGAYNRISTPCLVSSMASHSDFSKGMAGVYFGEYDNWGHVSLMTHSFISDIAKVIGYRQVLFTAKSRGSSPYAVADRRPAADRDEIDGNIFADLMK